MDDLYILNLGVNDDEIHELIPIRPSGHVIPYNRKLLCACDAFMRHHFGWRLCLYFNDATSIYSPFKGDCRNYHLGIRHQKR